MARETRRQQHVEELADLIGVMSSVRNGKAALVLSEQLSKVTKAVYDTGKKGKLTISIDLTPTSANSRGEVDEIKVELNSKLTLPSNSPGAALFYPTPGGTGLTQTDPDQARMFEGDDQ
jgi:hypothetical protein